jgi:hypothetical protein
LDIENDQLDGAAAVNIIDFPCQLVLLGMWKSLYLLGGGGGGLWSKELEKWQKHPKDVAVQT